MYNFSYITHTNTFDHVFADGRRENLTLDQVIDQAIELMLVHPNARTTIELYKGAKFTKVVADVRVNLPETADEIGARIRAQDKAAAQERKANKRVASFDYLGTSRMPVKFSVKKATYGDDVDQTFAGEKFEIETALRKAIELVMQKKDHFVYMNGPRGGGPTHAIMRNYKILAWG